MYSLDARSLRRRVTPPAATRSLSARRSKCATQTDDTAPGSRYRKSPGPHLPQGVDGGGLLAVVRVLVHELGRGQRLLVTKAARALEGLHGHALLLVGRRPARHGQHVVVAGRVHHSLREPRNNNNNDKIYRWPCALLTKKRDETTITTARALALHHLLRDTKQQ